MKKKFVICLTKHQDTEQMVKMYGWKYVQQHPLYSDHIIRHEFHTLAERKAYELAMKDIGTTCMYSKFRK